MSTSPLSAPVPGQRASSLPRPYWSGRADEQGQWRTRAGESLRPPGEDLSALRAGLGKKAFTEPRLWQYYTTPTDGRVTLELEAEHAALALYGLHQQSQEQPMHRQGVRTGRALRALHQRYSEEATDRRVAQAVGATSAAAFAYRLRALVTQLRSIGQPLDYDQLMQDLLRWHFPDGRSRVRRGWGLGYHGRGRQPDEAPPLEGS
ncbi:type I-E CRISPR-associated protein Cse2/CasB [Streptomyces albidoflavus]|uniref:type I-E CRISPR-associated protein Cse2/CasB n=1 Tax=Streptomyces albidoflavus TaxID=1886 RepID=UPI000BAE1DA6|nr:type I-E CRISPR-associated protein Cse2/CasB [Streptomyces albidoflavus]PAX85313.1 type I-E CRISPR-associated protein Cse2/CasB [Streptomyces albidoflavus]PAX92853.1 type I-E CRISPR-associated protein Cse2/CasB [Streptomyces albidoflavus]PBO17780.1 type I-E CRISPR-associated protein Cse2/CasB [Streptomyces albidoflavus]PBO25285.1 type I-E CRISPR-associated protein Cse2/CasB [Streptomyces albidoflavus]PBO31736.1 type I-E CRISPR-associated protein Cse2/CasB [Streptomyces albidoflavus]